MLPTFVRTVAFVARLTAVMTDPLERSANVSDFHEPLPIGLIEVGYRAWKGLGASPDYS